MSTKTIERFEFRNRIHLGVVHNDTVYLTGQVGSPNVPVAEQARQALDKVDALLAQAGSSKEKILHVTLVLDDIRHYNDVNEVWDDWVAKDHAPARSTLEGRLATPGLLVEFIVVAAR